MVAMTMDIALEEETHFIYLDLNFVCFLLKYKNMQSFLSSSFLA